MSEVKLNLIDSQETLHGTIHGSVADAAVAALSAEPETIAELQAALARYIKPLDDCTPFATFHSTDHSSVSCSADTLLDTKPWDAGIVVIDLAARIVAVESTYSLPQPEGEVHYHDGTSSTDIPVMYRLPDDWLFVNSVESYKWSRERRTAERLARTPLDVREVLYGVALLDFILNEFKNIDLSKASASAEHPAEHAVAEGDAPEDALATEISNIHARWLMTPREDLRGQSPREVLLARKDLIDFDLHTRAMQWSIQNEGPPCLGKNSFAYRFAGFGTHEFVIYYDLVRHLIWSLVESQPTAIAVAAGVTSNVEARTQVGMSQGQEGGLAPALLRTGSTAAQTTTQAGMSQGQEGGLAPALLSTQVGMSLVSTPCGSGRVPLIATLDQIKTTWLEQPQPEYGGRIPAILIDNERKRLPEAMRPRDMIIDEDCPMCQMFGDETTPLGMGVGFWHLDGCNMDEDFAFSYYKTREEWEAENRRRDEFNAEFNRKWEERQQRIARGETLEFDPFFDPDPFELDDASLISSESLDDDEDFPQ
ncbi:MAG: hypothetical protein M3R67_04810 [Acidobacteriota bacterium]|nr:hypothetical protein [Acidobacteriota bacterium]